ncbi:hypothetical protein HYC85_015430 [Camellia sinensis]|uniref:Major facilitator superfamily (MFS) profile domain-containing protein n=1 Tax=Camellia sinensis TaxID=4442 RepID=A0A7J7GWN8_CAMSI|nr:hypothetical protein HYC85_015430 [Camellia sinensis]
MEKPDHTEEANPDRPKFALPVDSEHKATVFRLFTAAQPHMRAFHLSWISFFCCFVSTFAAPPLLPIIRDNLNLTATDIGNAGIASVSGAVFARVAMGTACDLFGPRLASASLILLTSPAVYCFSVANSATSFLLLRFFTGFSLATFVSTQFWMSSMFSAPVVGTANGVSGGWGNLGGGATQLIMPLVFSLIRDTGAVKFTAWRIAFFIPALMQTVSAIAVFFLSQDLPDGNFSQLKKSGDKHKENLPQVVRHAVTNYRGWILALTYGYCFGVELTIDNIIAQYFYDRGDFIGHSGEEVRDEREVVDFVGGSDCGRVVMHCSGRVGSLGASIAVMVMFSVFVQAACGLTFGVVPFVSRRYKTETGITLMGIMMICCTLPMVLIYFPQWGGMFCGPSSKGATEEDYYMSEWNLAEKEKSFHQASLKFADNSRSERGTRVGSAPTPTDETPIHV